MVRERRILTRCYFCASVGFQAKTRLPQRLPQALDSDLNNALVHADADGVVVGWSVIVRQLKNVRLEAAVVRDNIGNGGEVYYPLAQEQLQTEQGLRADRNRSDDLNRWHCFGHTIHRPKRVRTLLWVDHLGDPQPITTIHHYYFASGHDPVAQHEFGWILHVFV